MNNIKLKSLINEDLPTPKLNRTVNWIKSLSEGKLIVKKMGRLSHIDEIYQYIQYDIKTHDYSLKGEDDITLMASKVGIILYDNDELKVNLYDDEEELKPIKIKLDTEWRTLRDDEKQLVKNYLKKPVKLKRILSKNFGKNSNKTYKEVIEKITGTKIIL